MSDDETKKDTVDETEGTDGTTAGPVAAADSSSSQAAGEEPAATPPADEAAEPEAPAAAAEPHPAPAAAQAEPAPAPVRGEEAPGAEPDPEDDLPWKERARLQRSRRPHEAKPTLTPEERAAQRREGRKAKAAER